jgi:hypothetical protein
MSKNRVWFNSGFFFVFFQNIENNEKRKGKKNKISAYWRLAFRQGMATATPSLEGGRWVSSV